MIKLHSVNREARWQSSLLCGVVCYEGCIGRH